MALQCMDIVAPSLLATAIVYKFLWEHDHFRRVAAWRHAQIMRVWPQLHHLLVLFDCGLHQQSFPSKARIKEIRVALMETIVPTNLEVKPPRLDAVPVLGLRKKA